MAAALECAQQLCAQAEARTCNAVSSAAVERLAAAAEADAALEAHAVDVRAAASALAAQVAAQVAAAHDAHAELDAARSEALDGALARASIAVPRGAAHAALLLQPRLSASGGAREKHD
jgi:hypothetical protein